MRCLVTGADGFLGANLCKRLLAEGHEVTGAALTRKGLTSLDALNVNVRLEHGDITDAAYVDRIINAYEPEWVFHLAAVSIVRIAEANALRALQTNIMGTATVLATCHRYRHVKRVVVASSDKAYGEQVGAYYEDMALKPTGAYELSKACADQIARYYGAIVTRCANLFGPGDLNWSRLVPNSCRLALQGKAPQVHVGAWDYRREWLDVESAVDAYLLLAEKGQQGEAYNVGSGERMTAGTVAEIIARNSGAPLPEEGRRLGVYEIPSQELCSAKARALGWEPQQRIREALLDTFRWYSRYLGVYREVVACVS